MIKLTTDEEVKREEVPPTIERGQDSHIIGSNLALKSEMLVDNPSTASIFNTIETPISSTPNADQKLREQETQQRIEGVKIGGVRVLKGGQDFKATVIGVHSQTIGSTQLPTASSTMKPPIIPMLQLRKLIDEEVAEKPLLGIMIKAQSMREGGVSDVQQQIADNISSNSAIPSHRQWQKVSFTKKRSNTNNQGAGGQSDKNLSVAGMEATSTSMIPKIPINNDNDWFQPKTYREQLISSPGMQREQTKKQRTRIGNELLTKTEEQLDRRRKLTQPGEIMPLFDCLFCCQEHFVLEKLSEQTLTMKYSTHQVYHCQERNTLFINLLIARGTLIPMAEEIEEAAIQDHQVRDLSQRFQQLVRCDGQTTFQTPLLKQMYKVLEEKNLIQRQELAKRGRVQKANLFKDLHEASVIHDDHLIGSGFLLKTRRQRIIENISFETECHNIYDPCFTSEEEGSSQISNEQVAVMQGATTRRRRQIVESSSNDSLMSDIISSNSDNSFISSSQSDIRGVQSNTSEIQSAQFREQEEDDVSSIECPAQQSNQSSQSSIIMDEEKEIMEREQSQLSSIERQGTEEDCFESSDDECQQRGKSGPAPRLHIEVAKPLFVAANILNIQENKYTPDQDDKESQKYTFGCLTPNGISNGTQSKDQLHLDIFNQQRASINLSSDLSPKVSLRLIPSSIREGLQNLTPIIKQKAYPIQTLGTHQLLSDLSPVLPNDASFPNLDRFQANYDHIMVLENCLTDNEETISKFNIYPVQNATNDEEGKSFEQSILDQPINGGAQQSAKDHFDNRFNLPLQMLPSHFKKQLDQGEKDICFSPIPNNETSISRDDILSAHAAREAIRNLQGPSFTSVDYQDMTMNQNNHEEKNTSSQIIGHNIMMSTSKFPFPLNNYLVISESIDTQENITSGGGTTNNANINRQTHTINLGYDQQSQSFSAFNSKHLLSSNLNQLSNQTPLILQKLKKVGNLQHQSQVVSDQMLHLDQQNSINLLTTESNEPCSTARGQRKKIQMKVEKKRILIKQDQLSILLQKALEKKVSQKQQHYNNPNKGSDTKSNKKYAVYESLMNQEDPGQARVSNDTKTLNTKHGLQSTASKKAPKVPGTVTSTQQSRKQLQVVESQKALISSDDNTQPGEQPQSRQEGGQGGFSGSRAKNYHVSFNNLMLAQVNQLLEMDHCDNEDRPLTLRNQYPNQQPLNNEVKFKHQIGGTTLAVSQQFLDKASKQMKQKQAANGFSTQTNIAPVQNQVTKQELNQYLKSAICSSRYSSSSIGNILQHNTQALPLNNHLPSFHNQTLGLGSSNNHSIDLVTQKLASKHKHSSSSGKKHKLTFALDIQDYHQKQSLLGVHRDMMLRSSPEPHSRKTDHNLKLDHNLNAEGNDISHYHQYSIDRTSLYKSGGKAGERKDSCKALFKGSSSELQNLRLARNLMSSKHQNLSGSIEKSRKTSTTVDRLNIAKKQKKKGEALKDKVKVRKSTKQTAATAVNNQEFQNYYNMCNSINFSNDTSLPSNKLVGTSLISQSNQPMRNSNNVTNSRQIENHHSIQGGTTKNHQFSSNPNHQKIFNNFMTATSNVHGTTIQDNSLGSNNQILTNLMTSSNPLCNQTSGGQCEMSTTISNNQFSLTRLGQGTTGILGRGVSTGGASKVNQTAISGLINGTNILSSNSCSSGMNQTTLIVNQKKVIVPHLELTKIQSSSAQRKRHLNGSQDEIQLQNLLQNINQHLQLNSQQTRAAAQLKDGSSTMIQSGNRLMMQDCFMKQPTFMQSNRLQTNNVNTKRSQASSVSAQRQGPAIIDKVRKDSVDQPIGMLRVLKGNDKAASSNLDSTDKSIKKKKILLTSHISAVQKDRKKKSKEPIMSSKQHQTQSSIKARESVNDSKKALQNSFTLKHLKLLISGTVSELNGEIQIQQQMTTRQPLQEQSQRFTDRNSSGARDNLLGLGAIQRLNFYQDQQSERRPPPGLYIKEAKLSAKHITNDSSLKLNRSSLNPPLAKDNKGMLSTKNKQRPQMSLKKTTNELQQQPATITSQSSTTKLHEFNTNRFYDTGKQSLANKIQSPHHNQKHVPAMRPSTSSAPAKKFIIKSVYSKQQQQQLQTDHDQGIILGGATVRE